MVEKLEIRKDVVQVIAESAATHAGRIATIISGAVRDVTRELGDLASDVFDIREAAEAAEAAEVAEAVDSADTANDVD